MGKQKKKQPENSQKVKDLLQNKASRNDPNGSYTGVPLQAGETPVQDSDDL